MGKGHEYQHLIHEALVQFEEAIVHREHKKMLESKIPLQQEVDRARGHVVDLVVKMVTEVRMGSETPS